MSSRHEVGAWFTAALNHHQSGRLEEAEALYRRVLVKDRRHADATHYLGLVAAQTGRQELAVQLMRRAVMLAPSRPHYYSNLSEMLRRAGDLNAALEAARQAVAIQPESADSLYTLALALQGMRQFTDAAEAYLRVIELRRTHAGAYSNLGNTLRQLGRLDEALVVFEQGSSRAPESAELLANWAHALLVANRVSEALDKARRAVELAPHDPVAQCNLGRCLSYWLSPDEAIAHYRRALELNSDYALAHSNLLFLGLHHEDFSDEQLLDLHSDWGRRHGRALNSAPHGNDRNPDRRLRVGYVSADFREHPVCFFIEPILANHGQAVEVHCYSNSPIAHHDAVTARLKGYGHRWRDIVSLTDTAVAKLIREDDHIDILVDLSGHTADHRLGLFAHQPAPVQATYLGYQATTGVRGIGYRLSDGLVDPAGQTDAFHTEQLVRLEVFACYRPPDNAPEVVSPPCLSGHGFTFGAYTKIEKISNTTLDLWAAVLRRVTDARLMIFALVFDDPAVAQRVREALESRGIETQRIETIGPQPMLEYLRSHQRVDLLLDTYPFNAHTTTCHALWMGVPTVTLCGGRYASRMGLAVMTHVGLDQFVATTPEQLVEIAAAYSANRQRLAELRATMRQRLAQSVMLDAARFTRHLEAAYRKLWQRWCDSVTA